MFKTSHSYLSYQKTNTYRCPDADQNIFRCEVAMGLSTALRDKTKHEL